MSMNRYMDGREVFDRRHGPSTTAAGDGQEGLYSGVLHTAPTDGSCKVILPAFGLTSYRTANVAPYVAGTAGDTCLVAFDEGKIPWVISAQSLEPLVTSFNTRTGPVTLSLADVETVLSTWTPSWIGVSLGNSWVDPGTSAPKYCKDPLNYVHLRGLVTAGTGVAFTLPAGFRPGDFVFGSAVINGGGSVAYVEVQSSGAVTPSATAGTWLTITPFLAEA